MGCAQDALAARAVAEMSGHPVLVCGDTAEVCREMVAGVGALLIGREVLTGDDLPPLLRTLALQPGWSHLPVIMILQDGDQLNLVDPVFESLDRLANVTLIESPVHLSTLLSMVRASIAHRRRQYQQRDLLEQLESSRREAIEANRAKGDFLANVSHEIRTPLGAILGFSELLMEPATSERDRQIYMKTVRRNGKMLSALINDLLDLAKVESGRMEIERIEFSLGEVLAEVTSELAPMAFAKNVPLVVDRSHGIDDVLSTDPLRLKQILVNVVGNAIKFTSFGSVNVRVDVQDSRLTVEIEDTGIGISSAQAARLFQPFQQADTSSTRRYGGTGLGLVLSRKLARALGGDLRLKWSTPGGGTCFELTLQVEISGASLRSAVNIDGASEVQPATAEQARHAPLAGKRILVVDDSPDNQVMIARILNLLGAGVDLAGDGLEAVNKAMGRRYDLVLMDLQMPRLGGIEATRMLREKGYLQPIVALTAHALQGDRAKCLSVGCTDYLTKPVPRAELERVLGRATQAGAGVPRLAALEAGPAAHSGPPIIIS